MSGKFTHGYALLIGVGDSAYSLWSLPVTVKDVRALRSVLTDPHLCAYPADEDHVRLLHDAAATRDAILDGLTWLKERVAADKEATAVVYYSGHGWLERSTGRYFLIPHDVAPFDVPGSALPAPAFSAALRGIRARRLLVFVDSCHAEGMATAKDEPAVKLPPGLAQAAPPKGLVDDLKRGAGRVVFTSSRGEQRSWIRPDGTMSVYTYHLLEALQGAANQPGDTVVRVSNLMNHLGQAVPESARRLCQADQTPFFDTATEDFPVAVLRGGEGLPAGGWEAVAGEAGATIRRVYRAELRGSGAIAQDHSVAASHGGVAVGGDVVTGTRTTLFDQRGQTVGRQVNVAGNMYLGPEPESDAEALLIYRRVLAQTCSHLPLRGVDLGAADATTGQEPLGLAHVYVDLDTTTPVELSAAEKKKRGRERRAPGERETRPLSALEAVLAKRRLVLLGDPGGGKTTFVRHLAHCLAVDGLERLPGWPRAEAGALPVLVILRDFAQRLPDPLPRQAEPSYLWDFIAARLEAQKLEFASAPICQALEAGRALLLLDGLDEVPTAAQRVFVRDAVSVFVKRYHPHNRVLVTCRVLSYQPPSKPGGTDLRLPQFPTFELAPFDENRIDHFIRAWYEELARGGVVRTEDAAGLARGLREAVRRPDLWRLAPNPLLLTVMALVHAHKGRLPDARAMLYEDTMDILLWRWEQIKAGGREEAPRLRQLLLEAGRTDVDLKRALAGLAYEAHAQVGADDDRERLVDIGELRLQKALAALKGDDFNWARQVIEAMKLRAGLLLERAPELFTFPHRTFQEYLAGAHLAARPDFAGQAARLAEVGEAWREVILLAVGRLVYRLEDTARPLALVAELCPVRAAADEPGWRQAWLAGDVLLEMGVNRVTDSDLGRDLLARVQARLADLVGQGGLAPRERVDAGGTLAALGDPRDLDELVEVPAGPFLMGSSDADEMAYSDEKPQHEVTLPAFKIGKYPITNTQYLSFVTASGHRAPRHWPEDAPPRGKENHPVVYVYWHDARDYCEWLTGVWRAEGRIGEDEVVRLPSEAQWEKAARGADGRRYPWGDDPDPNKANYRDSGIGSTSAVGCFPGGSSPYGVLDLSGNVDEWTRSIDKSYPYDPDDGREDPQGTGVRVVRGGAFYNPVYFVRCAFRDWDSPGYRYDCLGFRIVVAPG